jgi:tRNA pseudouridine55 synthase
MDGVVVINKPAGRTSHDVVLEVKKIMGARKAGHTGTLDPLATGVLPVCIDEATKLAHFFEKDSKDYLATMLLGVTTDTLDIEGQTLISMEPLVGRDDVEKVLKGFVGVIEQKPPAFSAVKYRGKSLYKWARQGVAVDVPSRKVEIYDILLKDMSLPYVTFFVSCSKGTYIRSLCSTAGDILGCGACLSGLHRSRSGSFTHESAIMLENVSRHEKRETLAAGMIPMGRVLPDLTSVPIDDGLAERIREGRQPTMEHLSAYHIPFLAMGDVIKFTQKNNQLVALGRMLYSSSELKGLDGKAQAVKILRVFNGQ